MTEQYSPLIPNSDAIAVALPTAGIEQIAQGVELRERLLHELPIQKIGNADPLNPSDIAFPNVLYHGSKQEFDLDDSLTHQTTPNRTGSRTGRGFYCAAEPVANLFEGGVVAEILPKEAVMMDLTDPQAERPFSKDFRTAFIAYQTERLNESEDAITSAAVAFAASPERAGSLVTRQEAADYTRQLTANVEATQTSGLIPEDKQRLRNAVASSLSRWNTTAIMQDSDTSLRTLFATYDSINGSSKYRDATVLFDITDSLDFFVNELGIDGAKTIQTFEPKPTTESSEDWIDDGPESPEQQAKEAAVLALDPDQWHGYVFWKLDKVGTRALWERRTQDVMPIGSKVLGLATKN